MKTWPQWRRPLRAAAACAVLLVLSWPASALAQEYPPSEPELTASTSEASPGEPVTVSGSGYQPGTEVAITFESTPVLLATVRADSTGRFTTAVRIPMDATPGEHTIKATGLGADGRIRVLSTRIFIRGTAALAAAPVTPAAPRSRLSLTGMGNVWPMVATALVLVLLGCVLMTARRRKPVTEPAG